MKKLISLIGAGAMLLSLAGPAFAWNWSYVEVENGAAAIADTGGNSDEAKPRSRTSGELTQCVNNFLKKVRIFS